MKSALDLAREKQKELREAGELERLDPIEKCYRNPRSAKARIRAMCYECMGRDADPNWRKVVGNCTAWQCPLLPVRPYQTMAPPKHGEKERADAVRKLPPGVLVTATRAPTPKNLFRAKCVECMGGKTSIAGCKSELKPIPDETGYRGCPIWPARPYQNSPQDNGE